MPTPFDHPVVSPVLIGRDAPLAALDQVIAQVQAGRGQTILISGEAGIGKSRLVAATKARFLAPQPAGAAAGRVLSAQCFEPDQTLPYAPLLDLLRTLLGTRRPADLAPDLGAAAGILGRLLPELAAVLPVVPTLSPASPEQEKQGLFQALAHLLLGRATPLAPSPPSPLLLVIEDLHWCDETSLDFLLYLARRLAAHPVLLLLTYRSDEVHPALSHFLATLDRQRLTTELPLARLTPGEVDALIRAIFAQPQPVRAEFLDTLYALTEGNPFFIEEVLKALLAAGEIFYTASAWTRKPLAELHIPRTIQDAVQRRTQQLSAPARALLAPAAVAGRRWDFALLQEVTGHTERELLTLIKELIAAQLVVEESAERFAFRHALTRQAVCAQLLARERRSLHYLIAEIMERVYAATLDAHLADLAYHYAEAGTWTKVLEYAPRAGEQAHRLYAPRAAHAQFTRAIAAAEHLGHAPPPGLYRARGQAYDLLGEFDPARADYERALAAARQAKDQHTEWQSLLDLGYLWTGRDHERAGVYLQEALTLARAMGDPTTLGHTLNRVGNWYANNEQPGAGRRAQAEALAIFEELGDPAGQAATLDLLGTSSMMDGDALAGTAYYERAIALFRARQDRWGLATSLGTFALRGASYAATTIVMPPAAAARCRQEGEEAVAWAHQIGWPAGEAFALVYLALALGPRGAYGRALQAAQECLRIATEIEHPITLASGHYTLGAVYLDLLMPEAALPHTARALALAQGTGALYLLRAASAFHAATCLAQHDLAQAAAVLDTALAADAPMQTSVQRLLWSQRAEQALAQDQAGVALAISERLIATAAHMEQGAVIPHLWYLRARAVLALGHQAEGQALLRAAQATAQAQEMPPLLWRIQASLGRVCYAQGRRAQGEAAFAAARAIIAELAAGLSDASVRAQFAARASALLPPEHPPTPRQVAKRTFGDLTEREREVAALIAQGKTNPEIAAALVLSKRTVQVHISNILAKLDFQSRAQIAAWVVEKGLGSRRQASQPE